MKHTDISHEPLNTEFHIFLSSLGKFGSEKENVSVYDEIWYIY